VCFLQCRMRITCRTEALLIGLALLLTATAPAVAIDNVVLQWNEATLDAIRNTKTAPPIAGEEANASITRLVDELIAGGLTPIRRWGQPEDVASAVAALVRGDIPFSTGERIHVDGGFHVRRL